MSQLKRKFLYFSNEVVCTLYNNYVQVGIKWYDYKKFLTNCEEILIHLGKKWRSELMYRLKSLITRLCSRVNGVVNNYELAKSMSPGHQGKRRWREKKKKGKKRMGGARGRGERKTWSEIFRQRPLFEWLLTALLPFTLRVLSMRRKGLPPPPSKCRGNTLAHEPEARSFHASRTFDRYFFFYSNC